MMNVVEHLAATSKAVPEDDLIIQILGGLPLKYDSFRTSITKVQCHVSPVLGMMLRKKISIRGVWKSCISKDFAISSPSFEYNLHN